MKKLWMSVLVVLMVGMFGSTMANATSIANVETRNPTLTVVFGAPAEFDVVSMTANEEMSNGPVMPKLTTHGNPPPSQPNVAAVPEPSTLILVGLGVLGLLGLKRQRKN